MKFYKILFRYFEECRDHFIAWHILQDSDITRIYPFRLLASMSIISISLILVFVIAYPLINNFIWPGSALSSSIGLILLSIHICLLHRLKRSNSHVFLANIMVFSTLIAIVAGITITGGPLASITAIFLPAPIVMAFLLINRETGLFYAVLTFSLYTLLITLDLAGIPFPQTIDPEHLQSIEIMSWFFFTSTILALVVAYDDLTRKLIRQLKVEQEKQTYLATHDALTGLANNRLFEDKMNEAIHRSRRLGNQVTLLAIDLNKLKPINDSFGHGAGDALLVHVAKQISITIRTDDHAARTGDDEFAIILQGDRAKKELEPLISRLAGNIKNSIQYDGKALTVSSSIGVAFFPDHADDTKSLKKAADMALYEAKSKMSGWEVYNDFL